MLRIHKGKAARKRIIRFLNFGISSSCSKRCTSSCSSSQQWISVVGLEIHAQIHSRTKLFSRAVSLFDCPVNHNVSCFDCALPGTLPVLNRRCLEAGLLTALALQCQVPAWSDFDRKHYFYADLPAGYQITQHFHPIAVNGVIEYVVYNPRHGSEADLKRSTIKQVQLEQDSGKSFHDLKQWTTFVDLNRCGIGLLEIVTDHSLSNGFEASCLVKELATTLKAAGTCLARMENYEIARHIEVYEGGGEVVNETRSFDPITGRTVPMRDKEVRQDYRYLHEPNLPPMRFYDSSRDRKETDCNAVDIEPLRRSLPVLPRDIRKKWISGYGVPLKDFCPLVEEEKLLDMATVCVEKYGCDPARAALLIGSDLRKHLHQYRSHRARREPCAEAVGECASLYFSGQITMENFLFIIKELQNGEKRSPLKLFEELDLKTIDDPDLVQKVCDEVLANDPKAVKDYKRGVHKIMKKFVRLSLEKLRRRVPSATVEKVFEQKLSH